MAFDYLQARIPEQVKASFAGSRRRMLEEEVRYRAGLLRRLGRDQETAVSRCLAQIAWGQDIGQNAEPVSEDDVRRLVAHVYR